MEEKLLHVLTGAIVKSKTTCSMIFKNQHIIIKLLRLCREILCQLQLCWLNRLHLEPIQDYSKLYYNFLPHLRPTSGPPILNSAGRNWINLT